MLDEKMLKIYGSIDVPSAGPCPTLEIVSISSPTGKITINKADFDATTMELYIENHYQNSKRQPEGS